MKMAIRGILFGRTERRRSYNPTQEQKQDIKEKRAEEQDRNIKNYWSERAKNADHGKLNLAIG